MKLILFIAFSLNISLQAFAENCKGEKVNDKPEGVWKCFYENGTIQQEGGYKAGKKEGEWKFYHANGKVALVGIFVADAEKGKWKVFDEEGKEIDMIDYGS